MPASTHLFVPVSLVHAEADIDSFLFPVLEDMEFPDKQYQSAHYPEAYMQSLPYHLLRQIY